MIFPERTLLTVLGITAAIAGAAVAVAGVLLALDLLLDPTVLFGGGPFSWSFHYSPPTTAGGVLFQQNLDFSSGTVIYSPTYLAAAGTRWLLAGVALAQAAVPAVVLLAAAGAARASLRGGLSPRLPRLAWMTAGVVVAAVAVASVLQAVAGTTVVTAVGIDDPLKLGWAFDAVCAGVALLLGIGGIILRHGARVQRDAEGLV